MTILSGTTIKDKGIISPFVESYRHACGVSGGCSLAGYDAHFKSGFIKSGEDKAGKTSLDVYPGDAVLATSVEKFTLPTNVMGFVSNKSTYARNFLFHAFTTLEPGWSGYLTYELVNHSTSVIKLEEGYPICQIVFQFIDVDTAGYGDGKYQNQANTPTEAVYA